MSEVRENEESMRSSALQISKSVLAARQRANEELVRTKENLEVKAQELVSSLTIMRATLEATSDAILVTDGQRRILDYNKKYVDMFNIPREIMESGDNYKRREFLSNQLKDPTAFLARSEKIMDTEPPDSFDELEFKDCRIIERYSKLLNIENPALGRVWSFHDITKQREAENREKDAKTAAERRAKNSEDFMALLSHELRTPLTPVLMTATAYRDDEHLPVEIRKQFAMIERNIALEVRLIDDLLDITSISYKKFQLNPQLTDTHSLIELAKEIVQYSAVNKKISIESHLSAKRSGLMADPARFQQIIWNLLRNAIKFTPNGGRITIRTSDQEGDWLRIEVTDTGIGIEPAELDKIFLPLEQATITRERRFGGLGLGLHISRTIVEMHGGKISASSDGRDRGATFIVELPGATASTEQALDTSVRSSLSAPVPPVGFDFKVKPLRILFVDDHVSTLQAISTLLTRDGHKVVTAGTIAEALSAAEANTFDLVISDMGLPDGSGDELMEKLRDTYGLRGIALSGYGTSADISRSREAGFAEYLVKPVHMNEFRRVLAELGPAK